MIHEPSLLQMRGTGDAAVVLHRKWPVTTHMQPDRLARRVKNADMNFFEFIGKKINNMLEKK